MLRSQVLECLLPPPPDFGIGAIRDHRTQRDREHTAPADGGVHPWLVVTDWKVAMRSQDYDRLGADGVRTDVRFPLQPAAARIGCRR